MAVSSVVSAHASQLSAADPRLVTYSYTASEVYRLAAQQGRVLHIQLAEGETVTRLPLLGDREGWQVEAEAGTAHVFLKPGTTARPTNMVLLTSRAAYPLELAVLPLPAGASTAPGAMYRVQFTHPAPVTPAVPTPAVPTPAVPTGTDAATRSAATQPVSTQPNFAPAAKDSAATAPDPDEPAAPSLVERLAQPTVPLNWAYSMVLGPASDDIVPSATWDDGSFTYLVFRPGRELPRAFRIGADNAEAIVNSHMDGEQLVLHGLARRWVLRLGSAALTLHNDAFSADGPAHTGAYTTVPDVARVIAPAQPSPARRAGAVRAAGAVPAGAAPAGPPGAAGGQP